MKTRYEMTSNKTGEYIEFVTRHKAEVFRALNAEFKHCRIMEVRQAWDDLIIPGRRYPERLIGSSRTDVMQFNHKQDQN